MSDQAISRGAMPAFDDQRPGAKRAAVVATVSLTLLLGGVAPSPARAEPSVEIAGASGFGAFVAGVTLGPYLSGGLGIMIDCAGTWITGKASPVWSGASVRCSAGPILRFTPPL